MNFLIIEDDLMTSDYIRNGLSRNGHGSDSATDGIDGLGMALRNSYDAIVLDRMLPGTDGLSILKAIRGANIATPVLFLTAIGNVDDRVEGLEAGADDYLVKPFAFSELSARLSAIARRPAMVVEQVKLKVGDLELDLVRRTVVRDGRTLDLLPKEFLLLETFMRNEGRVLSKAMLLERIWGFHFDPQTTVVETHVSRLRAKIDKHFGYPLLHTVRGVGYSLHAPL